MARGFWLRDELAGLFRDKFGRLRVFRTAASESHRVVVLSVGYRKEGDRNDAYEVFPKLLRSSEFDPCFEWVGSVNPLKRVR